MVLCVAKEVSCPWLSEGCIPEKEEEAETNAEDCNDAADRDEVESIQLTDTSGQAPDSDADLRYSNSATSTATTAHTLLPVPSAASIDASSRSSRSPSPNATAVRPLLVRPTASTPNLQQRFRESASDVIGLGAGPFAIGTPAPLQGISITATTSRKVSPTHSGYLYRIFPANRSSGRPAIEYTKLPWSHDENDIADNFSNYKICELIDRARENGGKCLVHCQLGVSRSATVMIGYCMRQALQQKESCLDGVISMHDSYTYVRSKSRWVAPNIGLLAQLVQYERVLASSCGTETILPYTNSAYYDSLSVNDTTTTNTTPDDLSPSSNSASEPDSRLATPEARRDLVPPTVRDTSRRTCGLVS